MKTNTEHNRKEVTNNKILENLRFELVSYERNKEELSHIPHTRFLDMSIVYTLVVDGNPITVINNDILRDSGLTENDLIAAASENLRNCGLKIVNLQAFVGETDNLPFQQYIVSCEDTMLGANIILFEEHLFQIAETIGATEFYLLPSSIHEMIAIPDCDAIDEKDVEGFKKAVKEVNADPKLISPDEVLSDNVYYVSLTNTETAHRIAITIA